MPMEQWVVITGCSGANGMMSEEGVYFPAAGVYRFEVIAKGDLADNTGPEMGLLIDGVLADGTVFVDTTTPETFVFEAEISEGAHTVAIRFYNDVWIPGVMDRNLYVDRIAITSSSCKEDCADLVDNDLDGFTDCADSDCTLGAVCCGTVVIEAEEMDYHANGAVRGDYWLLWANGMMSEEGCILLPLVCTVLKLSRRGTWQIILDRRWDCSLMGY